MGTGDMPPRSTHRESRGALIKSRIWDIAGGVIGGVVAGLILYFAIDYKAEVYERNVYLGWIEVADSLRSREQWAGSAKLYEEVLTKVNRHDDPRIYVRAKLGIAKCSYKLCEVREDMEATLKAAASAARDAQTAMYELEDSELICELNQILADICFSLSEIREPLKHLELALAHASRAAYGICSKSSDEITARSFQILGNVYSGLALFESDELSCLQEAEFSYLEAYRRYSGGSSGLAAQQEAQRMEFVLQKERQEAERKRIEAQGIADFQKIVTAGISEKLLEWKGIETTEKLAESPNTKIVIIGNPKNGLPLILGGK